MEAILGISAFYHDSAAALIIDGEVVAAAQEERFTRVKHDASFPTHAIDYCLDHAGITPDQIDHVGFYEKPLRKFERILETYLAYAPSGFASFRTAMPDWLTHKLHQRREIQRGIGSGYKNRICFCEHHESHAASAFFPSPFERAAILTMDGVGEWATSTLGHGQGNQISLTSESRFPHSLGLLYSALTYYCGFTVNSGEYKLMGLAPYGSPEYTDVILEQLIDLRSDGSFRMKMEYFNYCQGLTMTSRRFHQLFGRQPRQPDSRIESLDLDLAASIQKATEEIVLRTARHLHAETSLNALCMAGGVALNCVANGRLLREGPFEKIWVQPAAGDAGGALGTAWFIRHQLLGRSRPSIATSEELVDRQHGSLLGPSFGDEAIEKELADLGASTIKFTSEDQLLDEVATCLDQGQVVGWMQGRMEFGPRALGSRSILADPRHPSMQSKLNQQIKFRESFRPFAPAILDRHAGEYFHIDSKSDRVEKLDVESPYMTMVYEVHPQKHVSDSNTDTAAFVPDSPEDLVSRLNRARSEIPAVTHVDNTARVQTVDATSNDRFRRLLEVFNDRTGCPTLINTSFNVRGEPIVCTPADAYRCFLHTDMDLLVIGNHLIRKESKTTQPNAVSRAKNLPQSIHGKKLGRPQLGDKEMRLFGFSVSAALAILATLLWGNSIAPQIVAIVFALSACSAIATLVSKQARTVIYHAVMAVTWPLRFLLTQLVLAFVFFFVVVPLGIALRLIGHDALGLKEQDGATFWLPKNRRESMQDYFKMF